MSEEEHLQYREMLISDYEEIISLWQKSEGVRLRDADSKSGIEKYLKRNPGLSFICKNEGKIIGTIMSGHDGKRGYVQHLAVSENAREQGVGSKLISLCLNALKSEGILKSHIHVLANNELAQGYWLNRGWQERKDLKVYSHTFGSGSNT